MKRTICIASLIALVAVAYSCKKNSATTPSGTAVLTLPAAPDIYYSIGNTGNPRIADSLNKVATLGRVLFYDGHLSVNNAISCGSCHKQALGFADNTALSVGYEGKLTRRNSLAINTLSLAGSLFWDGRETNINNLSLRPITNHVEMGIDDPATLPAKLSGLSIYPPLFKTAYGDNAITVTRISTAIGVFIRSITSGNSRFDDYSKGNIAALTAVELKGMALFNGKYNCGTCHNGGGGYYGNGTFKDIGLEKSYVDIGKGEITGLSADNGTFRIPNLRNVALTAPYMHDGRYKTLGDVVDHYSKSIENTPNLDPLLQDANGNARKMNISDDEKAAIIAFMNTLTDFSMVSDTKFSNPFNAN
jgi:cytochrome c peroxidase